MTDPQSAPPSAGRGVRRLIIAMDIEQYSRLPDFGQVHAQHTMSELLREAGQHGALERAQWNIQQQGDGELALLPPGIDEADVITTLMRQVSSGLHRYNRQAAVRLRMRIAVHEGLTYLADSGFAGDAVNTACRLRDAKEAKDALRDTENDVILIVSERIYRDVICGDDSYDLPPASFRETEVIMADKGFRAHAFIYAGRVTDARPTAEATPGEAAAGPTTPATQGGSTFTFTGPTTVGDIAGRDVIKHSFPRPTDRTRDE
jgi:hypothetical protein